MKKLIALFALVIAAASPVAFTGCQTSAEKRGEELAVTGTTTFTVPIPVSNLEDEQVKRAIIAALVGREWTISQNEDKLIVGVLNHRGVNGRVMITWDNKNVTIEDDSHKDNGQAFVPVRWINNLKKDISKFLVSAA